MSQPVRLQLARRKGFNLQCLSLETNGLPAVNVARPGKWGNPFPIPCSRKDDDGAWERAEDAAGVVRFFRDMLQEDRRNYPPTADIIKKLRGKNLACWCKIRDPHGAYVPCHADVLLGIANRVCEEVL